MRKGSKHKKEALEKMSKSHIGKAAGANNPAWKGGITFDGRYLRLNMPHHPESNSKGYLYLHRILASFYIGRPLTKQEAVHHIDNDKINNHPKNIMIFATQSDHQRYERGFGCLPERIIFNGREL